MIPVVQVNHFGLLLLEGLVLPHLQDLLEVRVDLFVHRDQADHLILFGQVILVGPALQVVLLIQCLLLDQVVPEGLITVH